jgi:uncharacterized integral membrane protein
MTYASEDRPATTGNPAPTPEPSGVPPTQEPSTRESAGVPPAREPAGVGPAGDLTPGPRVTHTRTSAVWAGVWAGVVALIVLIVFIAQNTAKVEISFFALEGRIPLALALLIAGVAGAIVAMAVAAARIIQLRRLVRRNR